MKIACLNTTNLDANGKRVISPSAKRENPLNQSRALVPGVKKKSQVGQDLWLKSLFGSAIDVRNIVLYTF